MSVPRQLRLSLVAPSGSGKSTVAGMLKDGFEAAGLRVTILKLAAPLYELQSSFYRVCGVPLAAGQQDPQLLENIATHLRRIEPQALVRSFAQRLLATKAEVVLNDDLRDDEVDWPWMRANRFSVVRVQAHQAVRRGRLGLRGDLSFVENSPLDAQIERIRPDHVVTNDGSLQQLQENVDILARTLLLDSPWARTPRTAGQEG